MLIACRANPIHGPRNVLYCFGPPAVRGWWVIGRSEACSEGGEVSPRCEQNASHGASDRHTSLCPEARGRTTSRDPLRGRLSQRCCALITQSRARDGACSRPPRASCPHTSSVECWHPSTASAMRHGATTAPSAMQATIHVDDGQRLGRCTGVRVRGPHSLPVLFDTRRGTARSVPAVGSTGDRVTSGIAVTDAFSSNDKPLTRRPTLCGSAS